MDPKRLNRRAYLLSRVRKQGLRCDTRKNTVYFSFRVVGNPLDTPYVRQLTEEFYFVVQFELD